MDSWDVRPARLRPPLVPAAVSSLSTQTLNGPVRAARVLAAYPFGVYLEVGRGVLPVLTSDAVALPTSVRVAARAGEVQWGVSAGDEVVVGGGRIECPALHLRAARTWRPTRVRAFPPADASLTSASRASCSNHMQEPAVRDATSASRGSCMQEGSESGWLVDGIRAVVGSAHPSEQVARLLGRGPGLTPSGDDALAGAVLVEFALGRSQKIADAVRARSGTTTAVSRALLGAACQGYAAPQVVALVDAAVAGDDAAFTIHLPRVLAIGHTSGHDLVTGVLAALAARQPSFGRSAA
ncbi:MAG: DUF2877 domain-containing protein [Ornithinibacter sp.]